VRGRARADPRRRQLKTKQAPTPEPLLAPAVTGGVSVAGLAALGLLYRAFRSAPHRKAPWICARRLTTPGGRRPRSKRPAAAPAKGDRPMDYGRVARSARSRSATGRGSQKYARLAVADP
jgi:hypothetical protein